jgi:hypothetical protein
MMKSGTTKKAAGAKAPAKASPAKAGKAAVAATATRDPRKTAPVAAASTARKAVEAIAPVAAVATAEPKKAEALKPAAAKPAPVETAVPAAVAPFASAFEAGADQARAAYTRARENGETLRQAVTDSTTATTRAFIELNGKVIDALRAQSEATIDLWRSTLSAGTLSEAIRVQTHGLREAYETSSAQWKDIAATAGRLAAEAAKPLRSALSAGR